jgi:hypothetical protein
MNTTVLPAACKTMDITTDALPESAEFAAALDEATTGTTSLYIYT